MPLKGLLLLKIVVALEELHLPKAVVVLLEELHLPEAAVAPEEQHRNRHRGYCSEQRPVNFHSKCKILGGVAEFFSEAFLCRFPPEDLPRPVVYPVHSLPV